MANEFCAPAFMIRRSGSRGSWIPPKPTKADLRAAYGKTVPDVIAPNLDVLFCGINPGLYSGAVGHHFARPGNRFWPAMHAGGFTDRVLAPFAERALLRFGCGITNFVNRATAAADELDPRALVAGAQKLAAKIRRYHPQSAAILGIGAYRLAFAKPHAHLGLQTEMIGRTRLWVLPNPSGLNAHFQAKDLARLFAELKQRIEDRRKRKRRRADSPQKDRGKKWLARWPSDFDSRCLIRKR